MIHTDEPYPKLPRTRIITFGLHGSSIEHDPEKLKQKVELFRKIMGPLPEHPFFLHCTNCGLDFEYRIDAHEVTDWNCPSCAAHVKTAGRVKRFRKIGDAAWTDIALLGEPNGL
jgi:lipopolysaccharide biosynthesis regulator YciM